MTRPVGYRLADGTWITIPRAPIEQAGLAIPGWVTKPDGTRVWVEEEKGG